MEVFHVNTDELVNNLMVSKMRSAYSDLAGLGLMPVIFVVA